MGKKMKIILIVFLSIQTFACSEEIQKKQAPQQSKPSEVENKHINPLPLRSKSDQPKEHISGGGVPHISGASSSSRISGQ
jgi:hypothetical protein